MEIGGEHSVVDLVERLVAEANQLRASDIHIDPWPHEVRVRLRVDGVLREVCRFPAQLHAQVVSRIKVLASLRTDEHAASQDGRFRHVLPGLGGCVDLRVSVVPTYHGETIVMRLLSDKAQLYTLPMLGFGASDCAKIGAALKKQSGMILATGPTGSGKTTTLYTLLKMLDAIEMSIVTIEDPIEYAVDDIEQIQVNARTGLTFANGLRSILRQDPNVIMVGEIRDAETAGIAINTALTGHLLLSTLHTSDAATTLPRLLDMGIDAYLVASTVSIAVAQRLVRKICANCKQKRAEKIHGEVFFYGAGCVECAGSGYAGRLCINEVLVADTAVCEAILRKAPAAEIQRIAAKNGMTTMRDDGFAKARAGETTREEVLRVIHE